MVSVVFLFNFHSFWKNKNIYMQILIKWNEEKNNGPISRKKILRRGRHLFMKPKKIWNGAPDFALCHTRKDCCRGCCFQPQGRLQRPTLRPISLPPPIYVLLYVIFKYFYTTYKNILRKSPTPTYHICYQEG